MTEKTTNNNPEYIRIAVLRSTHSEIRSYLQEQGDGGDIGKFYDKAATDRLHKLKSRNTPFDLISTDTFIKAGWKKIGSSYMRENSVAMFTGTHWYCDGTQLTKDNWYEKIGDKTKADFNPK